MGVDSLGYLALNVRKPAEWRTMLEQVFGMEAQPRPGNETIDYRLDSHHHRFTLYPSHEDSIAALGWEVNSEARLDELAQALRDRQVDVTLGSDELRAERKVRKLYTYTCPMVGAKSEIFYGPLVPNTAFAPCRGISGYKTGNQGLGHIAFWVKDQAAAVAFYQEVMGFDISDYIAWDVHDGVFMHCNARHHTVAFLREGVGPAGAIMHVMLEATSMDDVGYGYDIVRDLGIPVTIEPGKHSNDHMQSFYLQTPSGFWIEYGFGGREIGPDWEIKSYDQPMLWGHRVQV
ncbi:VOC family protein [Novosphingobium arvoryzae]|uniref:Biphenyl-2,3-diol 1,2-dioxygenase n=1 Tax=Novosphingobium arvoryzae TaxID=1256514 RepID=A0A918RLR2_9SPHN|nr:VOC family protein [Novosphingobium arvoryzae]GHA02118.1 biphenyl-2,3-diol 1,2-dioxygenase [Novosphingobium arvoryzae]